MRQWELIGITDTVPTTPARSRFTAAASIEAAGEGHPVFFWTTDTALRLQTITGAASEVIGMAQSRCEGRDLISIFGLEGESLAVLDAHVAALNGETAWFDLQGDRATVRCRVAPTHDAMDRVTGTFCLATAVEQVDLRDVPERVAAA
jgi:hypothetical protein